jgi:aspartate oxidase
MGSLCRGAGEPVVIAPGASDIGCRDVDEQPAPPWPEATERLEGTDPTKLRDHLQRAMTEGAGVLRSPSSLAGAAIEVRAVARAAAALPPGRMAGELANLATVAGALLGAGVRREETRGAHARRDHPETSPAWRLRLVHHHADPMWSPGPEARSS